MLTLFTKRQLALTFTPWTGNGETVTVDIGVPLWSNRNYRVFLLVQTLSALGDSFSFVAIPLLVLHSTGSVVQMGLVTGLTGVASIVTGLFAGVIADRFDRQPNADALRRGALSAVRADPAGLGLRDPAVADLHGRSAHRRLRDALPGDVRDGGARHRRARPDHQGQRPPVRLLRGGDGRRATLAGLVAAAFGPVAAIGIDAATFAVSAAGLLAVKLRPTPRPTADAGLSRRALNAQVYAVSSSRASASCGPTPSCAHSPCCCPCSSSSRTA